MADVSPLDVEYLVFTAHQNRYGVAHHAVVAIIDVPEHTEMPGMPPEVRGLIVHQGRSIPLFDLRVCFGEKTRLEETQELIQNMLQRKQDHINWLAQLKYEVLSNKPITVQTNPELCAFGQWYKNFRTDNLNLNAHMQHFDDPHRQIHRIAEEAATLLEKERYEEAKHLIHLTERGSLLRLVELFDGVAEQVKQYLLEYTIIFGVGETLFAMATDKINFFGPLHPIERLSPDETRQNRYDFINSIGHRKMEGKSPEKPILLLDMERFVQKYPFLHSPPQPI
ncbi:MAG: chemotaxis protein CheW [Magnetococcales bacterium]|nr:chemotaxis protein CheW [Magnetococcales bacterium]